MRIKPRYSFSIGFLLILGGCGEATTQDAQHLQSALLEPNKLNPNKLNPNKLNPNALDPNLLAQSALEFTQLPGGIRSALRNPGEAGDMSREFMRFAVGCALGPDERFTFSWTDANGAAHTESYPGLMGLAPAWPFRWLTLAEQEWVSACLISRTNYYEASVTLSSRGAHPQLRAPTDEELRTYAREEGAFWGNLFATRPSAYACYNADNAGHSRDKDRDCAAGHVDDDGSVEQCGMIRIVGSCDTACDPLTQAGSYHPRCWASKKNWWSGNTNNVITVFLP